MPPKLTPPTQDEDLIIQAGIEADPDNPELEAAFFTRARPAREVLPQFVRRRGAQRTDTKQLV